MGVHHDNFDLWNSKHQPRWNAVATGPKKDVVGLWRKAARQARPAVRRQRAPLEQLQLAGRSHGADKTGPLAGVPYDGADPAYADLYHPFPKDQPISDAGDEPRRAGGLEAATGSCASRTWSTTISPTCSTPMAAFPSRNTATGWSRTSTTQRRAQGGLSTPARTRRIARRAPARSTSSAASRTTFWPNPGRPTPASATGTTSAAVKYKRRRR